MRWHLLNVWPVIEAFVDQRAQVFSGLGLMYFPVTVNVEIEMLLWMRKSYSVVEKNVSLLYQSASWSKSTWPQALSRKVWIEKLYHSRVVMTFVDWRALWVAFLMIIDNNCSKRLSTHCDEINMNMRAAKVTRELNSRTSLSIWIS